MRWPSATSRRIIAPSIRPGVDASSKMAAGDRSHRRHRGTLRGLLGQMLFMRDEGMKPTEALSGGEAARILFCKLMLQKPNVLVLDEPTNHLDLESINALNIALQKYEGTVFLVTHDHDLVEEVATRIWHFDGKGIEDFKGAYEEYQAALRLKLAWYRAARASRTVRMGPPPLNDVSG